MSYTILGLIFDIVGAWLLAYEFLWGYHKRQLAKVAQIRLEQQQFYFEMLKANIDKVHSPPFPKEDIEKSKAVIDANWLPMIKKNQDIVLDASEQHQDKAIIAAVLGISLLTAGFLLQIVGAAS
ncbi:MAG: hypothetical protein OEW58_03755 [Gammaproteobacteria bacterium]|nr:hypothetical protein [Gammaproteobacteria bacterium]